MSVDALIVGQVAGRRVPRLAIYCCHRAVLQKDLPVRRDIPEPTFGRPYAAAAAAAAIAAAAIVTAAAAFNDRLVHKVEPVWLVKHLHDCVSAAGKGGAPRRALVCFGRW